MLAKLVACILIAGSTACGLLVIRQHRIDAAHEMSVIHQRLIRHDRQFMRLRVAIHERLRQDHVAAMATHLAAEQNARLVPLLIDECFVPYLDFDALSEGRLASADDPFEQ